MIILCVSPGKHDRLIRSLLTDLSDMKEGRAREFGPAVLKLTNRF